MFIFDLDYKNSKKNKQSNKVRVSAAFSLLYLILLFDERELIIFACRFSPLYTTASICLDDAILYFAKYLFGQTAKHFFDILARLS
jgi:hypothetical protein